jgi:hypothetical protein
MEDISCMEEYIVKCTPTRLKHSFSQVEGHLDLQEVPKPAPLPKKGATKKKVVIVTMKEKDEEGEKAKKVGKNCANGEVLHMIAL